MRNWSSFAPNLSSWINAFLLAVLLIIATSLVPVMHHLWGIIAFISGWIFYFGAIFLYFLASILPQFVQQIVIGLISFITSVIGNLMTVISPLVLLLPIPIVAFAHHYLYLLLDRFYPDLTAAERGRVTGYIPGIMSWWHGLFALVVVIMAMLCSDSLLSVLPWFSHRAADLASPASEINVYGAARVGLWIQIALAIFRQPIYIVILNNFRMI